MEYYKPTIDPICFVYDHSTTKDLSIKCQVKVWLKEKESLKRIKADYSDLKKTLEKIFEHATDATRLIPYEYKEDVNVLKVAIISKLDIPYDPKDPEPCRIAIRKQLAPLYTLSAKVNPKIDGTGGGQATNTIASSANIDII
jgi:hypothetical protein